MKENKESQVTLLLRTLTQVGKGLIEFKNLFITIQIISLIYLIPNAPTIGASTEQVYAYAIISLFGLVWATMMDNQTTSGNERRRAKAEKEGRQFTEKPLILDRLSWRGTSGKIIKAPRKTYIILMIGVLAAILTAGIVLILNPTPLQEGLDATARLETAFQQLFIVTLPETVLFQGLLPLILLTYFFKDASQDPDSRRYQWIIVAILSQVGFAIIHNFVYSGDLMSMIRVGALGLIWMYLLFRFGVASAWGSHFGYNMAVLGLIAIGGI